MAAGGAFEALMMPCSTPDVSSAHSHSDHLQLKILIDGDADLMIEQRQHLLMLLLLLCLLLCLLLLLLLKHLLLLLLCLLLVRLRCLGLK